MKYQINTFFLLFFILPFLNICKINAQEPTTKRNQKNFEQKNIVFLRLDNHFEQRGENGNIYTNPEISIGYDRKLFGIGKNHFFAGLRTGYYYETVLTGWNYDHTYHHPFIGLYPSYMFAATKWFKIQVSGVWDIIFETQESIDDFWWWYFGIEPSAQFYPVKNFYFSVGATMGEFPGFEPPVSLIKAFIKTGFCF
jgi:hypothetical protein